MDHIVHRANKIRLVLNGDDFGLSHQANRAILTAYQAGALTSASLMVSESGCDEAVEIVRQNPGLSVGLHVALSDATPALPSSAIPLLVGDDGRFPGDEGKLYRALLTREGRRQIRHEISAQFALFRRTGLPLDHVNTHRNSYMHPLLAILVFGEAARHQAKYVRVPWDDVRGFRVTDPLRYARVLTLRRIADTYQLRYSNRVIGHTWNAEMLLDVLTRLPAGDAELYFHPTTQEDHQFAGDLPALANDDVQRALRDLRQRA